MNHPTPTPSSAAVFTFNGNVQSLTRGQSLADLVAEISGRTLGVDGIALDGTRLGLAAVRNGAVVPRSVWSTTLLEADDVVEILSAAQGG